MKDKILQTIRANDLHAWVFVTGAIILIIEVVAVRILAPFFGNTLFSVSSVLSVVLLALSAGYWVGGNLADKAPRRSMFYSIITGSGVLLLFLEMARTAILEQISENFSISSGPLVSAVILFIGPAFLLGMLSPYAIKLKSIEDKKHGIGSVIGGMFFWSTLGSITGSLMAGFVLIPTFGVDTIMLGVGVTLVALGGIPLLLSKSLPMKNAAVLVFVVSWLVLGIFASRPEVGSNVLYQADGVYEKITISEGTYDGKPARFLIQDRSSSGAAFVDSDELVYDYTKYYSVFEAFGTTLEETLVLGGGSYSIPRAIHDEPDQPVVDVVEIEPDLYELSQIYFDAPVSDRLHNYVDDGRRFLAQSDKKYDLIYGDVYKSLFSLPTHFTTAEFFELVKDKLSDDGVYVSNVIADTYRVDDSFVFSEMQTFRSVFPNSHFYATRSVSSPGVQNIIFVGALGDERTEIDYEALSTNENPVLAGLGELELLPERYPLNGQTVLTDNYAPVDFMVSRMLNRSRGDAPTLGEQTLSIIEQLVGLGPRHAGSSGGDAAERFLRAELRAHADFVAVQEWEEDETDYSNILARFGEDKERRIILGTHYDSKQTANLDENNPDQHVPGANDSSSGVAVLVSLARELKLAYPEWPYEFGIDLVFFDGEEGPDTVDENPLSWRPIGSEYFADNIESLYGNNLPEAGVILDMVCEKDAVFKVEPTSLAAAPNLVNAFWDAGSKFNDRMFSDERGLAINDDHTSLNAAGVPSIVVIDFEYPYFHTTEDTPDKCSADTLQTVTAATLEFLKNYDN